MECEEAFQQLKVFHSTPPILSKSEVGKPIYLYISVTDYSLSSVLVQEEGKIQKPVYFVSRTLHGAEIRYQKIEKLALALITTARKLRPYFQTHQVIVRTNQPIRQVLQKPDLAGRMMNWSIELSEFGIVYEPRDAIKAQALSDFVAELSPNQPAIHEARSLSVDGEGVKNTRKGGLNWVFKTKTIFPLCSF